MAYQVDKFNGTFLVSVADGTIDTTTDLRFVGKNYAGYGELQNENFLHLLENFANTTPPPKAITGQIWYDSSTKKLKFYDGTKFKVTTGAEVAASPPTGLTQGDFWWDTSTSQLYVWTGDDFELVGPEASPELGQTAVVSEVVRDNLVPPVKHSIIKFLVGGKCVAIVSSDDFTLGDSDQIIGFNRIHKGYTLVNTQEVKDGITTDDYIHWGTASNALKIGGYNPDDFVLKSAPLFDDSNALAHFTHGYTLGGEVNDYILRVFPENQYGTVIANTKGIHTEGTITVRIYSTYPSAYDDVAVFTKSALNPGVTGLYSLGTSSYRWKSIFADEIDVGSINGNIHGDTYGSHHGNVIQWDPDTETSDGTIIINAKTKTIGYEGASIVGNLLGNVQGDLNGTANNSNKLGEKEGSIYVPTTVDKSSVVVRAVDGAIYATRFVGPADTSTKLKIDDTAVDPVWNLADADTTFRSAKTTQTAYSIAARDANADLTARIFNGTATAARFADLAEKYLADAEYEVGTVVTVGGEAEVTACKMGDRAIGVVSENPAFMMNKDLEGGIYIALKGRVPCKVIGPVVKGQKLVAGPDGYAQVSLDNSSNVFAISLTSDSTGDKKIIEAIIL